MSYKIPSLVFRKLLAAVVALSGAALLVGCGPEAPACNDPQRIEAVLRMVAKGHDEDLGSYQFKTADVVSIEAGTPAVTSYDESIKRRSCEVHLTFAFKPAVVQKMNFFMDWMGSPLGAAIKYDISPGLYWEFKSPQQYQIDATVIRVVTGDRVNEAPLRLPVTYKIVKDEGVDSFSTSVSYSTATTAPYLKVASDALAFDQRVREILSAHGTTVPPSMRYGQPAQSPAAASPTERSNASSKEEELNLQRVADSIMQGNPKRGTDLPQSAPTAAGTAQAPVPAVARSTQTTAPGPTPAQSPAAVPVPQPPPGGGPESLMSLIVRYEPCGEEAVCLHTGKGNTVWMQAGQMRRMDYTLLDQAISKHTPVCLRDLVRTEGKNFTAEGLDSQC